MAEALRPLSRGSVWALAAAALVEVASCPEEPDRVVTFPGEGLSDSERARALR